MKVASIDENKNTAIERLPNLILKPLVQTTSLFARVKKGVSCWGWSPSPNVQKISNIHQTETNITKMLNHNTNSDIQR